MNEIETHIQRLFEHIPESSRKHEIMQEIIQNLNEKLADLMRAGEPRALAVQKIIEDFGDIEDIEEEMAASEEFVRLKKAGLTLAFSIWGTILILALALFVNLYYTPRIIWFVYPAAAALWWPMTLFFHWRHLKTDKPFGLGFSISNFMLIVALVLFINFYYTPHIIWFVYPAFAAIWWPLALLFHHLHLKNSEEDETNA